MLKTLDGAGYQEIVLLGTRPRSTIRDPGPGKAKRLSAQRAN